MPEKKSDNPITYIEKPLYKMTDSELHDLLDTHWYPDANNALVNQRYIWDYSYLTYRSIMTNAEINYKRRKNGYGLSVFVPRTFATIEGIRKNININELKIDIEEQPGLTVGQKYKLRSMLNYDLDRSGTRKQIKDAGFEKLLYGNGFTYSFLMDRKSKRGKITGEINKETGRVKVETERKATSRYYGMVAKRVPIRAVFPDPNGTHYNVDNVIDRLCQYTCIRLVKHISTFRRDWEGIVPKELLDKVKPGGADMTNYDYAKETIDYIFNPQVYEKKSTVSEAITNSKISRSYSDKEFVEERLWIGEDFFILQAGAGLPFLIVSCNPNPEKRYAIDKMDDIAIPGEFWSMGEPQIMRYQQVEENRVHNSVLDLLHFNVSQMMGINTQYLEDPTDTEVYPGKVWKFKAIPGAKISDAIQAFQTSPAAIAPAIKFMQETKQTGQQATSITDFVTGASKSIADTATESNRLASASDITIVDKIREMVVGTLINISKNWLAQYSIAYKGEKIEMASAGQLIYFTGKNQKDMPEKELKKVLDKGVKAEDIVFNEDLDISNPRIKITGDIEINKDVKLRQWSSAINHANNINKIAFETGDPRRIDTVQMGLDSMANFDVIANPESYLILEQETKSDQLKKAAEANKQDQEQNGGRPKEAKTVKVPTKETQIRSDAQPAKK